MAVPGDAMKADVGAGSPTSATSDGAGKGGPTLALGCPSCERARVFVIAHRHVRYVEEVDEPEEFTLAICSNCSLPIILTREYDFEGGFEASTFRREYPPLRRQIAFSVPTAVRQSYDEAVRCEEAQAWMAVAAMAGRALEAICKDFYARSSSIHEGF